MKHYIYPSPGSFNDFCERNPEIVETSDRLRHLSQELSMWRSTSPDIDRDQIRLTAGETTLRFETWTAMARGEKVISLTEWPQVGDYEIPTVLDSKAA